MVWLSLLGSGLWLLARYSSVPGTAARAPAGWPIASKIPRSNKLPTLLVFAHPHCPCTRATLAELARLMPKIRGKMETHVLVLKYAGQTEEWAKSGLWSDAESIPAVTTVLDIDGAEAKRFGAETSGQTLLYGVGGDLVFQGGLTPSRGHEGDSEGKDFVAAYAAGDRSARKNITAAFGCSLGGGRK